MSEKDNGGPQERPTTNQGTPKGISSTLGQMNVSKMDIPTSGKRKRLFLLECEEDADGELSYCRRIPIYDEHRPKPGAGHTTIAQEAPKNPSRREHPSSGCAIHLSDVAPNMRGRWRRRPSQESEDKETSKKD